AEDGIRDRNVTGVQTCALPISSAARVRRGRLRRVRPPAGGGRRPRGRRRRSRWVLPSGVVRVSLTVGSGLRPRGSGRVRGRPGRSEERRVGKEGGTRWTAERAE